MTPESPALPPEKTHLQRIPNRSLKGYYNVSPYSERAAALGRPGPGDPGWITLGEAIPESERCGGCGGCGTAPDEEVNKHRSHYMRWATCPACGGTGRKETP